MDLEIVTRILVSYETEHDMMAGQQDVMQTKNVSTQNKLVTRGTVREQQLCKGGLKDRFNFMQDGKIKVPMPVRYK